MEDGVFGALFGGAFLSIVLVIVAVYVFAMWRIFEKAGQEGWKAIVPIYNNMVLAEIVGRPSWWGLLTLIPYIGPIFGIILMYELGKVFGKDAVFSIVFLVLFSLIGILMLAFGDDTYVGPSGTAGAVPQPMADAAQQPPMPTGTDDQPPQQ